MVKEQFVSLCVDLGTELGKNYYEQKADEKRLQKALEEYFEKEWNKISKCSQDEEIDYMGLVDFLRTNATTLITERIFNPDSKKREAALQGLISMSCHHASADTESRKATVKKFVTDCFNIIRDFYARKIKYSEWLLASEITDTMISSVNQNSDKNTALVIDKINKIDRYSPNALRVLAQNNETHEVQRRVAELIEAINADHPLNKYYRCDIRNNNIVSVPKNAEALKLFPPQFICNGTVTVGEKTYTTLCKESIDYAYRHQLEIVFNIETARKTLGAISDPYQSEAESLFGKKFIAKPQEFPPATLCNLLLDEIEYYKRVLLRIDEIMDDNTIIISNREQQDKSILLEIKYNTISKHCSYMLTISDDSNSSRVDYLKFMKHASKGGCMRVFSCEQNDDLLRGQITPVSINTGFKSIDDELDFFERVVAVEDYLKEEIIVPEKIMSDDYNKIHYLSDLINWNVYKVNLSEQHLEIPVDGYFRNHLKNFSEDPENISIVGEVTVSVYNKNISIPLLRLYQGATIKDYKRLIKKLEYCNDGELFDITISLGKIGRCLDVQYKEDLEFADVIEIVDESSLENVSNMELS